MLAHAALVVSWRVNELVFGATAFGFLPLGFPFLPYPVQ